MKKPRVSTREFEMSHGTKPRGWGMWMFAPESEPGDTFHHIDYAASKTFTGTYSDAKKQAVEAFRGTTELIFALS